MKLKIEKVSQRGYSEKLGTSAVTIDAFGCALASLTMVENYFGFKVGILELNNLLIEKGVYANRNLMQWWSIQKVNEFVTLKDWIDCVTTPAPIKKIEEALTAGLPVILHVDLNPNQPGADHFIVCIGMTEDKHLICLDPWYKDEDAIFFDARYGDPTRGIFRIMIFNGPVTAPEAPKPSVSDLNGQIDQYQKHLEDIKEHLRPAGIAAGDDFPKIIGSIDELVSLKNEYAKHLEKDKAEAEKPIVIVENDEKFISQFKLLNLIVKLYKGGENK
jgi:hypothetical protein